MMIVAHIKSARQDNLLVALTQEGFRLIDGVTPYLMHGIDFALSVGSLSRTVSNLPIINERGRRK